MVFTFLGEAYIGKIRGIPLLYREALYSIGIYKGKTPFCLKPDPEVHNHVITYKDVNDIKADFVADPFIIEENGKWYMFFEAFNKNTGEGDIGCARSNDGIKWKYDKMVLDGKYHLSYPYVFKYKNGIYMIPESHENYTVILYKANNFPYNWICIKNLLHGDYCDPGIIFYNGFWWLFVSDRNDILHLFYSKKHEETWKEHPKSPVVFKNTHYARSGGRIIMIGD